jgi:hypothetical protein
VATLKIFFHDNCFDGAASAAVFADFYRARVDAAAEVVLQGVQHRRGDPFEGLALDGDDNACVDFRYCADDRMTWWFDHHVSAFQPPELRRHFEADQSGQKFFDPTARSNTKFQTGVLEERFGYRRPDGFAEVVDWADVIDGARFPDARTAVALDAPATQLMTWLEANRDPALTERFIRRLGRDSLADLAAEPWIQEPLAPLLQAHRGNLERFRRAGACAGGVCSFDLSEQPLDGYNKFIPYYLYPEATYTVVLSRDHERVKVSVGFNPWSGTERRHSIAGICERYGGGGHPVVGAVSLEPDRVDEGRRIAAEIRAELQR